MKQFLTLALTCFPLLCFGAPTYTTYFNNTHTYTNATIAGTNFAGRGVFTNGITAGASTFTGAVGFADGSATAPSIGWTSDADGTGTGFYRSSANTIAATINGSDRFRWDGSGFWINDNSINLAFGTGRDVQLYRDGAANTLALRNGTSAQKFSIYNTFTDASNYERLGMFFSGNTAWIATEAAGTGTARALVVKAGTGAQLTLGANNASIWNINASGHFLAGTDNTYDIGASGATRPRNLYIAGNAAINGQVQASGSGVNFNSFGFIQSSSDGVFRFVNQAGTDFNRLQYGGTTSGFPAEKRNGVGFSDVLADDSGPTWRLGTQLVTAKTADYTVTANDSRTVFTNEGTTAIRNNTLPGAAAGLTYTFIVQDTDGLTVTAAAGDTIRIANSVSGAAGNITTTTVGNTVTIVAINATEWVATAVNGTWTVSP